jgi:hypothetical protein
MIKNGVLALNALIATLYLIAAGLTLLVLKMASRPLTRFEQKQRPKQT